MRVDIEKEVGDVDIGNVCDDDLSDIEARILSEFCDCLFATRHQIVGATQRSLFCQ